MKRTRGGRLLALIKPSTRYGVLAETGFALSLTRHGLTAFAPNIEGIGREITNLLMPEELHVHRKSLSLLCGTQPTHLLGL